VSREPGKTPRLVFDADVPGAIPPAPATEPGRPPRDRTLPMILALLLAVVAIAGVGEYRRASRLQARVAELTTALDAAQAEIAARSAQLDAIRGAVGEIRERVGALESLAGADPAAEAGSQR
jgi:hypothetical protein